MASREEDTTASYTEPSTTFSTTLDTSNSKLDITRSHIPLCSFSLIDAHSLFRFVRAERS